MKKKVIKICSVAFVLAALLAAMVMPSAAASGQDLVSIDFDNSSNFVDVPSSDSFIYDPYTGWIETEGGNSTFYLATSPELMPMSGCYYFTLGLWCEYSFSALDFSIKYRYNGMEYELFNASTGCLWANGSRVCYFDGTRIYLTCVVNLNAQRAYFSVSNDAGTVVSYCEMYTSVGGNSISAEDRMLYIDFPKETNYKFVEISKLKIREIPAVFMQAYSDQYFNGFDIGHNSGYQQGYDGGYDLGHDEGYDAGYDLGHDAGYNSGLDVGYNSGYQEGHDAGYEKGVGDAWNLAWDDVYDEGYAAGKVDGYQQGAKDTYNDAFQSTLDKIDENEGTLTQGFLAGMWNGVQSFVQELLDGITFSGLSLRSIVTTLFAIVIAAMIIKVVKGG